MNLTRRQLLKRTTILILFVPFLSKVNNISFTKYKIQNTKDDLIRVGDNSYLYDGWVLKSSDLKNKVT